MFSAIYKFNSYSKGPEPWLHSPALSSSLSDQSSDDTFTPPCTIQPTIPFDSLLSMDPTFMAFDEFDTYLDLSGLEDAKPSWEAHASMEYSNGLQSCYEQFQSCDDQGIFDRSSLSPVGDCFSADLYNYASRFNVSDVVLLLTIYPQAS
jgi:hypothetical protein